MEDKIYSIIKVFTTNSKYDEYYMKEVISFSLGLNIKKKLTNN